MISGWQGGESKDVVQGIGRIGNRDVIIENAVDVDIISQQDDRIAGK